MEEGILQTVQLTPDFLTELRRYINRQWNRVVCYTTNGGHDYFVHKEPRHLYVECVGCLHRPGKGVRWAEKPFRAVVK
jgi:hypothetical protein